MHLEWGGEVPCCAVLLWVWMRKCLWRDSHHFWSRLGQINKCGGVSDGAAVAATNPLQTQASPHRGSLTAPSLPGPRPRPSPCLAASRLSPHIFSIPGIFVVSVQALSHVRLFVMPWTAECQALSSISQSLLKLMSTESVMPSNHPVLSSCIQSFPASGSFPMSWPFASGGQSIGASASASVLPVNTQG